MTTTAPVPLLTAATPREWLATHLVAHQAAHDEDGGSPDRTWITLDELLADGAAALRAAHARLVTDGATPQAAAKWLVSWFAGRLADAVGHTWASAASALLVRPDAVRFRLHPDRWPDRADPGPVPVAVAPGHPWAGQEGVAVRDADALADAAVAALTAATTPVVEACRTLARVGRPALWAEVADGFGLAVLFRLDVPVDPAAVDRLRRALDSPVRPWRKVPSLRVARESDGPVYLGRKGGCCLAYQCDAPGEPDPAALPERERAYHERFPRRADEPRYCSTCSLRDLAGCEERQLFWWAQERAAHRG